MYRLLVVATKVEAVCLETIEFENKESAETAFDKIIEGSVKISASVTIIRLY